MFSISRLFPVLAIAMAIISYLEPAALSGWKAAIVPLLSLIMFCMGLTLRIEDFKRITNNPQPIALGLVLQFLVMPISAVVISNALGLPDEIMIGMVIVGACAGGTASNVMTFLAGGDVALSVSMTLASTLWGVVATPWIISFIIGEAVAVDTMAILFSIVQMVVIPLIGGILVTRFAPEFAKKANNYLADIASALIIFIIGIIVALNADELTALSLTVALAVMLHNLSGLLAGYYAGKLTQQTEVTCRTLAIEVGMQNSGLGVALAVKYFTPMAAVPAALFSIWHNISGSIIARYWKRQTEQNIKAMQQNRKQIIDDAMNKQQD